MPESPAAVTTSSSMPNLKATYYGARTTMSRRKGSRVKSKRVQQRKAQVKAKIKMKVSGSPEQVHSALKKLVGKNSKAEQRAA